MPRFQLFLPFFATLALAGCNARQPDRVPALGIAYAGPATLNLRRDIDPKSATVAIVRHGDKLEIIGQRRRSWYRVRTATGVEGWTSNRELLDSGQMARLRVLATEMAGAPSQGAGTTFTVLNVHSEPNRQSASFAQLAEHEQFEVIAHRVVARTAPPKRELIPEKPKATKDTAKKAAKKDEKSGKAVNIPAPPEPLPPPDWVALSGGHDPEASGEPASRNAAAHGITHGITPGSAPSATPPVATDDWTLIRTAAGQSGWVLTSAVYLQIPDEVAQYAEGRRITSYFSLGKTTEGSERKDIWLWTTSDTLGEDHDFDGFRVFAWSHRHHRYETAYIQRRERGFFPVIAKEGAFSVCLEKPGGMMVRKQYVLVGEAVRPSGEGSCQKPGTLESAEETPQQLPLAEQPAPTAAHGLLSRLKARATALFHRKP